MKRRSKSMIKSALILSGAGAICKVLGMIYRILLSNILGTQGMGSYQLAYSIYGMLLVAVSGGMPAALSAIVAKRFAKRDFIGAEEYLRASTHLMGWLGVAFGAALYLFSGLLSKWVGMESVKNILKTASPAIFFVGFTSCYRGFYHGAQDMLPSAFSQVCEQTVKIAAGIYFSTLFIRKGEAYGAVGAMLGVTISEATGLLVAKAFSKKRKKKNLQGRKWGAKAAELVKISLPITLGMAVIPMLGSVDSILSMKILQNAGYTYKEASGLYGLYSGFVLPVINLPGILASSISASLVPAISAAIANDRKDLQQKQFSFGLKAMCVLGIPLCVGFWTLAEPILSTLYKNLSSDEMTLAVQLFRLMAPCALFSMIAQITGGMLQGMDHMGIPVINLVIGAVSKILLGVCLIGIPQIHMKGAAIGSVCCYLVAAVLNTLAVLKYGNGEYVFADCFLKPLIASLFMLVVVNKSYAVLCESTKVGALICSVFAGVLTYGFGIMISGAVKRQDFSRQSPQTPFLKKNGYMLL